MAMKRLVSLYFFLSMVAIQCCIAQAEPQWSHYMYNRQLFNPAVAGSKDAVEFNLVYRTQYVGLSDKTTSTQAFGVNLPIYAISSGIGLTVVNDLIGYMRTTAININYDYRHKFSFGALGVGVGVGIIQTGLEGDKLRTPDGGIGGSQIDPKVPSTPQNGVAPDIAVGIYLNSERYMAGIAINHLYSYTKLGNTTIGYARNMGIMGGYDFRIGKHFRIMPSALIKTDFKEVQTDLSFTMHIYDNIMTGLAFRGYDAHSLDAVIIYAGFKYRAFKLVYSYDINTSYLHSFNTGSHEISVGYDLKMKKRVRTGYFYHNSRFL